MFGVLYVVFIQDNLFRHLSFGISQLYIAVRVLCENTSEVTRLESFTLWHCCKVCLFLRDIH